ncbi:MAG: 30S ribosomal protein S1, partial [Candidatus Marinimicrobia bacterium]|nr:30S ribosomal protein S1 [Candidatus Neomarinimicrobiota bacterium]
MNATKAKTPKTKTTKKDAEEITPETAEETEVSAETTDETPVAEAPEEAEEVAVAEAVAEETAPDDAETETVPETEEKIEEEADEEEAVAVAVAEAEKETEPEVEKPAEVAEETDYLAADLLDSIAKVTPQQLESMEKSEIVKRDETLATLIASSVGEISEDKVISGRVIGMNEREVLVDIGFKSEGIVPREEFRPDNLPQIGDEILVYLVRMEDTSGQTVLSKEKADFMHHWAEINEKAESGETIMGRVSRRIKGGMIVDLGGVPAFLPGSQIDIRPVQDFDEYIGQEFEFKIVKLNEARKNIVLSRKELLEADMLEKRHVLIAGLEVGQILEGRVKNITDFGVFVDLGGLDGLLHITDLSWGRVSHPSEVVSLDDDITVKVIDFDPEKQRVSLGFKQLQPHPWDQVSDKYPVGTTVNGKVVSMTNYGAFVEIEKGVEGLVHVSEMSWTKHIRHPSEVFTLGESIEAKILQVDVEDRKISLGVKQLEPDPWDKIEDKYISGSLQKGTVRNLTQFGAFVELEEGIDGLIHITDLSWTVNVRHPKEILNKGDEVEVRILDVSRENRRIALGLKQVADDPWEEIEAYFTTGKVIKGEVYRLLEKGVILKMEMGMEGIIPLRDVPKHERKDVTAHLDPGDILEVTVQELRLDEKKVILMSDALYAKPLEKAKEAPA